MNVFATVFGGSPPVLPHVTWPIVPHDDESLPGFTARTCVHNGLWNPSVLIADAGFRVPKGFGHLPRVSRDLSELATLLAVDPTWVEDRQHRTFSERSGARARSVNFHGAILRRVHLDYRSKRVAPSAILEHDYHREIWHVLTLAACATTGELLVDTCQQLGCSKSLDWAGANGNAHCADPNCRSAVTSSAPENVPETQRPGLSLAAALIQPSESINSWALAMLPVCLRKENRGYLFELAWLLGCLDHPEGPNVTMSPRRLLPPARCKVLARGADRLRSWPNCLTTVLRLSTEGSEAASSLKVVVETIQAIVRKPTTFGRPAALLEAELKGISTSAFSTVIGGRLELLTATEFARVAGLKTSKMAVLQRSTHLPRVLFSEGGRDIALFRPSDAVCVHRRIKERLSAQAFACATGLGIDAVELLLAENTLLLANDPIIQALWPEPHLERQKWTDLVERITRRLREGPAPDGSIKLSVALHGCPAGDKPWPAIIDALLAGRLNLYRTEEKRLNVRSCLISRQDMRTLHTLRGSSNRLDAGSEWLSEADARERISTTGQRLRLLVEAERLSTSGLYTGLTYRRSEVDAMAAVCVSTLELQAKLGQSRRRDLSSALNAVGLIADEYGLVPRCAARVKLGLPLV